MWGLYDEVAGFVESLTPTWRKTQRRGLTEILLALDERPSLCLSEIARALPQRLQPLHGRLKRLARWLSNPRLDEGALFARWLRLCYRFASEVHEVGPRGSVPPTHLLPVLLDTVYFEPFAVLLASVPCGSRGLPLALTTYHRQELAACLPTPEHWPNATLMDEVPPRRNDRSAQRRALVRFASQNHLEAALLDLVWQMVCPRLTPVLVADRGFARASLFEDLVEQGRDFVIRMDAQTHIAWQAEGVSHAVSEALPLQEGEQCWRSNVYYHRQQRIQLNLLALWESGQREPWYLVTTLPSAAWTTQLYRWRMRIECTNRDSKTGLLLRQGGDQHRLTNVWHMHTLALALACAEWWYALVGLQAWHELPHQQPSTATETIPPAGPALPPPVQPHRSPDPPPRWMRPFAARGWLSYVRLGWEICHVPQLHGLVHRMVVWLRHYLDPYQPLWRPWQRRYRQRDPALHAA